MNSKQLYFALSKNKITKSKFDGIYSKDTLLDIEARPELIICNTDPSDKPGQHWVLFFFDKKGNVEFFDSLGKPLKHYGKEFVFFAKMYSKKIKKSVKRTQPKGTALCGIYCLYYAYFRCKGYSKTHILNKMKSPKTVVKKVQKVFKLCPESDCPLIQNCVNM